MTEALRTIFMGTPEIAVPALRLLASRTHVAPSLISESERVNRYRGRKTDRRVAAYTHAQYLPRKVVGLSLIVRRVWDSLYVMN